METQSKCHHPTELITVAVLVLVLVAALVPRPKLLMAIYRDDATRSSTLRYLQKIRNNKIVFELDVDSTK